MQMRRHQAHDPVSQIVFSAVPLEWLAESFHLFPSSHKSGQEHTFHVCEGYTGKT